MKKIFLISALIPAAAIAMADITVNSPSSTPEGKMVVEKASVANFANARSRADLNLTSDTIDFVEGTKTVAVPVDGDYRFKISFDGNNSVDFYTRPGENIVVNITQFSPIRYTLGGTPLVEGMSELYNAVLPIEEEAEQIQKGLKPDGDMQALFARYNKVFTDFIEKTPSSPAAVFAIMNLDPETFSKYEEKVAPAASKSALFPLYEQQAKRVKAQIEADRKRIEMEQNHVQAPAFTLPDLQEKDVSLSDFRGKWLILDFWGSWCGWCIKGFPELKAAYEKYKPELEVIGIDCQETPERWKAGVERHQLPWVHVYLSQEKQTELLGAYGVQGFPTKVIVNPEGKIMNITSGEDPAFYTTLAKLMGK